MQIYLFSEDDILFVIEIIFFFFTFFNSRNFKKRSQKYQLSYACNRIFLLYLNCFYNYLFAFSFNTFATYFFLKEILGKFFFFGVNTVSFWYNFHVHSWRIVPLCFKCDLYLGDDVNDPFISACTDSQFTQMITSQFEKKAYFCGI